MIQIAGGILLAVLLLLTIPIWLPLLGVVAVGAVAIGMIIMLGVILAKVLGGDL